MRLTTFTPISILAAHALRAIAVCSLAFASVAFAAKAVAGVSLQQAVLQAVERDADIQGLRQKVARRTIDIQSERDKRYPSLSLSGESSTTDSNGAGITLTVSQVLFDWGMIRSKIDAASQARVQAVSDMKMAVEDTTLEVAEYFIDVETINRKISRTRDYMAVANRIAGQAADRAKAGLGDNAEAARARLEIVRAQDRMAQLTANRQISLSQIEFLIGQEMGGIHTPPDIGFAQHYSSPASIRSAVRLAPDYVAARAGVGEAEAGIETAKASRLPTIQLQAQGRTDLNGGRSRTAIGIATGVDLSSSGLGRRKIQSAQLEVKAAKASLLSAERELTNTAKSALEQLQIIRRTQASKARQLAESNTVLENYEEQFTAGQRELIDVLTTARDLYDAQIEQLDTYAEGKRTEYNAAHDLGVLGTLILASSKTQ